MFDIGFNDQGGVVVSGRLDAANAPRAQRFLDGVQGDCVIDMTALEYISSAGLGVLLSTHKRLTGRQAALELVNVSPHIGDIFRYSGFDRIFVIRVA